MGLDLLTAFALYLVLEGFLLAKNEQESWESEDSWKEEFELD